VVQRFPELDRVYQGMTVDIGFVVFGKVLAVKKKGRDLSAVHPKADGLKIPAHAQIKSPSEDVRGLKACQENHPLSDLIFGGRYDRNENAPDETIRPGRPRRPSTVNFCRVRVDGLFSFRKLPSG
jgi:hypothetical protein